MIPFAIPPSEATAAPAVEPLQIGSTSRIWQFKEEHVLGTQLEVLVNTDNGALAAEAARGARREIDRLERVFNHRRLDSEISALNRARCASVTPDLFAVVEASELWRSLTGGAFDARIGALLDLWANNREPDQVAIDSVLATLNNSTIHMEPANRQIRLSANTRIALDAVAKGYIVDAALNAGRLAAPGIEGLAVSIGGDLRCWGVGTNRHGWRVDIPDASFPVMNAPVIDSLILRNAAIATSGRGPRDCIGNQLRSSTLSALTGKPVRDIVSASVVASHAMDADVIATACMVMSPDRSIAMIDQLEGVAARITDARGNVHVSSAWIVQLAATSPEEHVARLKKSALPARLKWPTDWVLSIDYTAPPRQTKRTSDFRSPYMAMWITDANNKPIRTILMVGSEPDWQRDNFVWWGTNRPRAEKLVELRSLPTSISGRYPVYWTGVDDDWNAVPVGKYTLHLETSQERGKHNYRSVTLELGRDTFRTELPMLEGSGEISIFYGHPNQRYK